MDEEKKCTEALKVGDSTAFDALFHKVAKATVTGEELKQGSVYDYGLRNHITSTSEGGADIVFGRFLDELGWEFNQEGRRRQDMIRFGVFTGKSWFSHSPNGLYRSLYPIPLTATQTNANRHGDTVTFKYGTMTLSRKDFFKKACAAGVCMCGFSSVTLTAGKPEPSPAGQDQADATTQLKQAWIALLLANLEKNCAPDMCRSILKPQTGQIAHPKYNGQYRKAIERR